MTRVFEWVRKVTERDLQKSDLAISLRKGPVLLFAWASED